MDEMEQNERDESGTNGAQNDRDVPGFVRGGNAADDAGRRRNGNEQIDDPVEYHYQLALKLRPNFALAALNLGAWQYARNVRRPSTSESLPTTTSTTTTAAAAAAAARRRRQLNEAEQMLVNNCAILMQPELARDFNQHVQTQIECLVSCARMHLEQASTNLVPEQTTSSARREIPSKEATSLELNGKQLMGASGDDSSGALGKLQSTDADVCAKISHWMDIAMAKVKLIDASIEDANPPRPSIRELNSSPALKSTMFGDLNKQLGSIQWFKAKCCEFQAKKRSLMQTARSFAMVSKHSIEPELYLDHIKLFASSLTKAETISLIKKAIDAELGKATKHTRVGSDLASSQFGQTLSTLLSELARLVAGSPEESRRALERVEQTLLILEAEEEEDRAIVARNDQLLSLAGQLAHDSGDLSKSQKFYERALKELGASTNVVNDKVASGPLWLCSMHQKPIASRGTKEKRPKEVSNGGREAQEASLFCKRLAKAYTNYGAILQVNGNQREASHHYRRALDCDPNNSVAATNLERIMSQTKRRRTK